MRSPAPSLLPIFRSRCQAEPLAWLYLHPDQEFTTTDLVKQLSVPLTTLHGELHRLVGARLIHSRTVGRSRLLRAATDHPVAAPLTQLLLQVFGPQGVVGEAFAHVEGVHALYIYGSWAARYVGQPGPPPSDVDVLVVGAPSRKDVYEAADVAQDRLGLAVNPTVRTVEQWERGSDGLLQQIKASPIVTIIDPSTGSSEGEDPVERLGAGRGQGPGAD